MSAYEVHRTGELKFMQRLTHNDRLLRAFGATQNGNVQSKARFAILKLIVQNGTAPRTI
jgi:hypothetical protein